MKSNCLDIVAVEVVMLVVQEGDREGEDEVGGVSRSAPPPLVMEIFLSPAMRLALAPPNSSWIIFIF